MTTLNFTPNSKAQILQVDPKTLRSKDDILDIVCTRNVRVARTENVGQMSDGLAGNVGEMQGVTLITIDNLPHKAAE